MSRDSAHVRSRRIAGALLLRSLDIGLSIRSGRESPLLLTVDERRFGRPGDDTGLVVVALPVRLNRRLGLPLMARRRPTAEGAPTASELARDLIWVLSQRFPRRRLHMVAGDGLASSALRELPENVTVTLRMPERVVIHGPAPPKTGRRGRPRRQGDRLGTLSEVAAAGGFTEIQIPTATGTAAVKRLTGQWYSVFGAQPVQVVLVRETAGRRPFDVALASTDLQAGAEELVARYAATRARGILTRAGRKVRV
jgi:hypothetical protein